MANLTKEERDKLPESDFAGPDRSYPITDQDDVDSAAHLIGKADDPDAVKRRIIAIAKRKGLTIPDAWKDDAKMSTVHFSALTFARYEEGGFAVYPNSLLFRAGDYPDKQFSASVADLPAMASACPGVKGNIEHKTFLSGRAGEITAAWTEEGDSVLRGVVKIPLALDGLLSPDERRISLEIDRATKQPKGFALTASPRVPDAVLMSLDSLPDVTFASRHDTAPGQMALQRLHDISAQCGAMCKKANADMHSAHELKGIQAVHDLCAEHGAKCMSTAFGSGYGGSALYSREKPMNWWQKLLAGLRAKGVIDATEEAHLSREAEEEARRAAAAAPQVVSFAATPEYREMAARIAQMEGERQTIRAEEWADGEIRAKRALTCERGAMVAAFCQAAQDDRAVPAVVTFAVGGETKSGSRVDLLRAQYASRSPHVLFDEMLKDVELQALFNQLKTKQRGEEEKPDQKRVDDLLSRTPEGRRALAERNGK